MNEEMRVRPIIEREVEVEGGVLKEDLKRFSDIESDLKRQIDSLNKSITSKQESLLLTQKAKDSLKSTSASKLATLSRALDSQKQEYAVHLARLAADIKNLVSQQEEQRASGAAEAKASEGQFIQKMLELQEEARVIQAQREKSIEEARKRKEDLEAVIQEQVRDIEAVQQEIGKLRAEEEQLKK